MANILDKFKTGIVGSNDKLADYDCVISPSGDFTRITGVNVIVKSWINILKTPVGTYDHDPEYGCDLYKYVFEPVDEVTKERIEQVIYDQLFRYEDRGKLKNVNVLFYKNRKGFRVDMTVDYEGQEKEVTIDFDEQSIL